MPIATLKEKLLGIKNQLTRIKNQQRLGLRTNPVAASESNRRESIIECLERELGEERAHAAQLRRQIDELHFKIQLLETGYSKQLDDARARAKEAEDALIEKQAQLGELHGSNQSTTKSLADLRDELEHVTAERDRLRRAVDPAHPRHRAASGDTPESPPSAEPMSIDDILEDAIWAREQERINKERGMAHGVQEDQQDGPMEDMVAPDLMFSAKHRSGKT
jgi:chromosome segregation ATPase